MDFMKWLSSLDELLYEVMSWLVFFPVTLWRTVRHPLLMMDYADVELGKQTESQYSSTLSPPLFLVLALLLSHGVELAISGGTNPIVASKTGLAGLVNDDTSLLVLRLIIFALFPLILATRMLRARRVPLSREQLQAPFYAQCYSAGAFALFLGLGMSMTHWGSKGVHVAGLALGLFAFLAYFAVQTRWFAHHLGHSRLRGLMNAAVGMSGATVAAVTTALLFSIRN